jgi:hypothetical protein
MWLRGARKLINRTLRSCLGLGMIPSCQVRWARGGRCFHLNAEPIISFLEKVDYFL